MATEEEIKLKLKKSVSFVFHIEKHLEEMNIGGKVMCKICNKDIDEIYEKSLKELDDD